MTIEQAFHKVAISRMEREGNAYALAWARDFDFSPGQLVEVGLDPKGPSRLYSIYTGVDEPEAGILFTLVEGGELTPSLVRARAGDELWIRGPSGSFPALSGPGIWIANGTGVAPFVSMARSGLSEGKRLVHGARALADFYFHDELARLMGEGYLRCSSSLAGRAAATRDAADDAALAGGIYPGRLTSAIEAEAWDAGRPYELCGSASMVVEVRDLLIEKGVPHPRIVSEVYF